MSCEQNVTRLSLASRLSAGIGQLAGKRGFYAGLALAGLGLLGAGAVALVRRRSDPRKKEAPAANRPALIDPQQIPNLESRRQVTPLTSPSPTAPCATCQTPANAKPGPWYRLEGRTYCQDCAPAAAREAGVDLVRASTWTDTAQQAENTAGQGSTMMDNYLSPQRRINTTLVPSRIALNIGSETEPARCIVEQGYVLVRPDGYDTGLAITPGLKTQRDARGALVIQEDPGQWWLTHLSSGRRVTDQPYSQREQAHVLGNILAQLDWTRDEAEFSPADYRRARATIAYFNRSLIESGSAGRSATTGPSGADSMLNATRRVSDESLTGKLVADGYGGVSRVLEDNGDTLFLIDSLGKRYEITRHEARTPDESDFELCRVAMSFDPAQQPDARCATCQRSARDSGAGERWYKMGWQAFCESCSTAYAANEGYLKEEEIDADLESLG